MHVTLMRVTRGDDTRGTWMTNNDALLLVVARGLDASTSRRHVAVDVVN